MASLVPCTRICCLCMTAASANHATLLFNMKAIKQGLASRINHLLDVNANDSLPLFRFESQVGAAKVQKLFWARNADMFRGVVNY